MKLAVKKIGTLTGHSGAVYSLSEGPREKGANSPHFFTGSSDKFLALWNLETLQAEKFAAQFPSIVYAICHVPEKKLLLVGTSAGSIHILDLANKKYGFVAGEDFKTGQTKLKSVIVDFLASSGIKPLSIVSYNHLGNNDGKNLDEYKNNLIKKFKFSLNTIYHVNLNNKNYNKLCNDIIRNIEILLK